MSDTRKLVALFVAVMGFGVIVFGVVRGLSDPGMASGTRMIVRIAPPVDQAIVAQAESFARQQAGKDARVFPTGDRLVIELPTGAAVDTVRANLEKPGAQHPLHVEQAAAFTRDTSFWARARLFLIIGGALIAGAALIWLL